MWKKIIFISLCISVLIVFSAPISTVNAGDRNIKVNWQITGTIVNLITLHEPGPGFPLAGDTGLHSLLNLSAQGPPGPAKITILSRFEGDPDSHDPCSILPEYTLYFDKNDGVAVFPNNSFLYVSINTDDYGISCPDGSYQVTVDIDGGTGFYAGASGTLYSEGYTTHPASSDGTIGALFGTITGEIEFND